MNQHQRQIIDYFREENRVVREELGLFLTVMIRAFPPSVRFTGVSFSYNLSYAIFGGVTPLFVSWLVHVNRLGPAHYVAAVTLLQHLAVLMVAGPQCSQQSFAQEDAGLAKAG